MMHAPSEILQHDIGAANERALERDIDARRYVHAASPLTSRASAHLKRAGVADDAAAASGAATSPVTFDHLADVPARISATDCDHHVTPVTSGVDVAAVGGAAGAGALWTDTDANDGSSGAGGVRYAYRTGALITERVCCASACARSQSR
jgi:hypothetical protein